MATLTDYRTRLDREPLTSNQRGRIMAEFARLGFHPRRDRAERLRLAAALAQLPELASTKYLTMGQAGRVVGHLIECQTARDLYAVACYWPRCLTDR
jgi:hypothetical protein